MFADMKQKVDFSHQHICSIQEDSRSNPQPHLLKLYHLYC